MAIDTLQVKAVEGLLSFTNTISHPILESSYFVRRSFTPQFSAENLLRQSLNLLIGQNLLGQLWCLTF